MACCFGLEKQLKLIELKLLDKIMGNLHTLQFLYIHIYTNVVVGFEFHQIYDNFNHFLLTLGVQNNILTNSRDAQALGKKFSTNVAQII